METIEARGLDMARAADVFAGATLTVEDDRHDYGEAMNENDGSTARGFDPDTAPDLSKGGWPEEFAKATVRRGRPPKARP